MGDKGLKFASFSEIESLPDYVPDVDPKTTKLVHVITDYHFIEKVHCSIKSCHTPHYHGYVIATDAGKETNIGGHCARKHFGENFVTLRKDYEKREQLRLYRSTLAALVHRKEELNHRYSEVTHQLRPIIRKALSFKRELPQHAIQNINRRIAQNQTALEASVKRTKEEMQLLSVMGERDLENKQFRTVYAGSIRGLNVLRDRMAAEHQTLRDILHEVLETNTDSLKFNELKRLYERAQEIDLLFKATENTIREAEEFFAEENLRLLPLISNNPTHQLHLARLTWDAESEAMHYCHEKKAKKRLEKLYSLIGIERAA